MTQDKKWMERALLIARKGRFTTSPNPLVGCCLVKAGRLVAEGHHHTYGGDHAEVVALTKAGRRARGATLYVTLEPCSTWGKTPPCVTSIIESGVKRVVIGSRDPNPKNRSKGMRLLRQAGLRVDVGVLDQECRELNPEFFKFVRTKLPYVTLKMAQSFDGKIATRTGASRWITSPTARRFVHELRAEQDAIMIGKNTLKKDDPSLTVRKVSGYQASPKPWRVVLDADYSVSPKAKVLKGKQHTLIVVSEKESKKLHQLRKKKVRPSVLLPVPMKEGQLDLKVLLKRLGELGVMKVLVEGGGELAWSLLNENLVDRTYWLVAPKIIGGRDAKTSVEGIGIKEPSKAFPMEITEVKKLGQDWLFEATHAH